MSDLDMERAERIAELLRGLSLSGLIVVRDRVRLMVDSFDPSVCIDENREEDDPETRSGVSDMRERAAKLAEGWWPSTPLNMLAARIRALPLDPETGGE